MHVFWLFRVLATCYRAFQAVQCSRSFHVACFQSGGEGWWGGGGGMMTCIVYDDVADALSLIFGDVGDER